MKMECDHKYVFKRNDSFWYTNGRYAKVYVSIDYYFCERCLSEEPRRKSSSIGDHEEVPDWAKLINHQVAGL